MVLELLMDPCVKTLLITGLLKAFLLHNANSDFCTYHPI